MKHLRARVSRFVYRSSDESIQADVIGTLFVLGAILTAVSLAFPHPESGELTIELIVFVALATGALLIAYASRVTTQLIHAVVAFGSLLINILMLAAGVAAGVYAGMFCWVVLVSVNFFPLRAALAHFAWMMGGFAIVLTMVESSSGYSAVSRWLLVTMALAVTGAAGLWLVSRRRMAERVTHRFIYLSREMLCSIRDDGSFSDVNPAWRTALGYSEAELRSRPVASLVHPNDRLGLELAFARLRNGNSEAEIETGIRTRMGGWKPVRWELSFSGDEDLIYARVRERRQELDAAADGARAAGELQGAGRA